MIKKIILSFCLSFPLIAGDIMVERMQSVVDEVSELRKRYEDSVHKNEQCLSQLKEQNTLLSKKGLNPRADKKQIEALESENTRLKQAHQTVKQKKERLKELESEVANLKQENKRINTSAQILVTKNQSLLDQVNKLKRNKEEPKNILVLGLEKDKKSLEKELSLSQKTVQGLEKNNATLEAKLQTATSENISTASVKKDLYLLKEENRKLLEDLNKCKKRPKPYLKKVKNSKGVCIDDNPFPKLLKKEKKIEVEKVPKKATLSKQEIKTSSVFRIKGESAVYDKPNENVIAVWEDTRSFTSNISKEHWVKITGFFVDRKWRRAKSDMWVKKENTISR